MRPVAQQPPGRHRGGRDRVGRGVIADPELVEDDEDDRARSCRSVTRRRHGPRRSDRSGAMMPAISSGLSDAPPTSAPSIDGSARNSPMFAEVTLPPYRIGSASAAVPQPSRAYDVADRARHRGGIAATGVPPGPDRRTAGSQAMMSLLLTEASGSWSGSAPTKLVVDDRVLLAALAFGRAARQRTGRRNPASTAWRSFPLHQVVGLGSVALLLGVSDDDPGREADEHRRGDLAGVGAAAVRGGRSRRADPDAGGRSGQGVANRAEAHQRWADHPGDAGDRVCAAIVRARSAASAGVVRTSNCRPR